MAAVDALRPGGVPRPAMWLALVGVVAACAPDLDIAVSLLFSDSPVTWHSGPTHTLAFALLAAALAALVAPRARGLLAAVVGLSVASHVLVDFLTGPEVGLHRSFGVPALWPWLVERLQSPVTVFRGVRHGSIAIWFTPHNLTTAAIELLFALPVSAWALSRLRRPPPVRRSDPVAR